MTEDEAKTKWCPFARVSGVAGANRWADGSVNAGQFSCIGSACMAWRWKAYTEGTTSYDAAYGDKTLGYCGLAGKP